jgi:DNA-binding response OmpR family regulator
MAATQLASLMSLKSAGKHSMGDTHWRILIVDDDIALGSVLQQALELSSNVYEVRLARNADEALAQVSRRSFDLIITDIRMEGLSGLQLLSALRQVAPDVRTIAMTAFSTNDIEERARKLGVYGYLRKPFNIQEFRELVSAALEAEEPSMPEKLLPFQAAAMNETLTDLRANTGARAAFFIDEDTARVLGVASDTNELDLTSLAPTLVEITHRQIAEVAKVFGGGSSFRRSQYVGEIFNLTTYRLAGEGLLILVYTHQVKEGIISFYARQALEALAKIMAAQTPNVPFKDASPEHKALPTTGTSPPQDLPSEPAPPNEEAVGSEPLSLEQALARGLLDDDFFNKLEEET